MVDCTSPEASLEHINCQNRLLPPLLGLPSLLLPVPLIIRTQLPNKYPNLAQISFRLSQFGLDRDNSSLSS